MSKFLTLVLFMVTGVSTALAHTRGDSRFETEITELALGEPRVRGNGCPEGSVGVSLTPDKKTVSFIFDQFISESGNSVELKKNRKRCSITLPIDVPKGWQVTVLQMEQRGFYSVPKKGQALIQTQYSLWDKNQRLLQSSIIKKKSIRGPADDEFTISNRIKNTPVYSHCGQKVNFKIDTTLQTQTNKAGDDVFLSVDSLDASADNKGFHLTFLWKRCHQN